MPSSKASKELNKGLGLLLSEFSRDLCFILFFTLIIRTSPPLLYCLLNRMYLPKRWHSAYSTQYHQVILQHDLHRKFWFLPKRPIPHLLVKNFHHWDSEAELYRKTKSPTTSGFLLNSCAIPSSQYLTPSLLNYITYMYTSFKIHSDLNCCSALACDRCVVVLTSYNQSPNIEQLQCSK